MKHAITLAFLIFGINFMSAQFQIGVKSGVNISSLAGGRDYGYNVMGVYFGGFVNVPMSEKVSFQPELLISMQGARSDDQPYYSINDNGDFIYEGNSVTIKENLTYLNLPLMIQYRPIKNLELEIGPQIGISLQHKFYSERYYEPHGAGFYEKTIKEESNIDFGGSIGAEYLIYKGLGIGARYNKTLLNTDEIKNSVISIGLSYRFNATKAN